MAESIHTRQSYIWSFSSLVASGLGGEFLMNLEHCRAHEAASAEISL
jgi:hypothetical protein